MTSAYDTGQRSRRLPGAVLDLEGRAGTPVSLPRKVGPTSPSPCGGAYRACVSAAWHNRMSPAWSCRPLYTGTPSLSGRPRGRYSTALAHNAHPSAIRMLSRGWWWWGNVTFSVMGCGGPQGVSNSSPVARRAPLRPPPLPPSPEGPGLGPALRLLKPLDRLKPLVDRESACVGVTARWRSCGYSIA